MTWIPQLLFAGTVEQKDGLSRVKPGGIVIVTLSALLPGLSKTKNAGALVAPTVIEPKSALAGDRVGLTTGGGGATPVQFTVDDTVTVPTVTLTGADKVPTAVGTQLMVTWQEIRFAVSTLGQVVVATVHDGCEMVTG